jgi:hypothetical protein
VPARGRDLERALGCLVTRDVGEIDWMRRSRGDRGRLGRRLSRASFDMLDDLSQRREAECLDAKRRGLGRVLPRDERGRDAREGRTPYACHDAADRSKRPIQGELAEAEGTDVPRELTRRTQHAQRDGEVEAGALLSPLGRSEVHNDAAERELEPGVADRCPNALARLGDRGVGHADHGERGQPIRDVGLDRDHRALEPPQRAGGNTSNGARRYGRRDDGGHLPQRSRPACLATLNSGPVRRYRSARATASRHSSRSLLATPARYSPSPRRSAGWAQTLARGSAAPPSLARTGTAVPVTGEPPHYGPMSWRVAGVFFALGVITRVPFQTEFMWAHDSVLYARSIERFDPLDQRPQAPGYLYYVLLIRAIHFVVADPNRAMTIVSLIAGAAAIALLYLLAARMYDERTARASGAFLLTAVTFWTYGGVAYPYTLLAALSIGCALLFWLALRAESGRGPRLALATAAYGIAIGFRTDLAVFLAPLWLLTATSVPLVWAVASAALGAALVLGWFFGTAALDGGIDALLEAMRVQAKFIDERYSVFGELGLRAMYGNLYELARFLGRGLYFLAALLVAVPLSAAARRIEISDRRRLMFLLLWTLTPLAIYIPIHVGEYGYVFSMLPGLCVIAARGAIALARGARMPRLLPWVVASAALANAAVFLATDTPLSARDITRRDSGVAERIDRLNQPDLAGSTIISAYDAVIVQYYFSEDERLGTNHVLFSYDPALSRRELVFNTQICNRPGDQCRERDPVVAVWDDLIRVSGSGWQELRMPHGAKLRVARNVANGTKIVVDGLSVELQR